MVIVRSIFALVLFLTFHPVSWSLNEPRSQEIGLLRSFDTKSRIVYSASVSPDGDLIAIAGEDLSLFEIDSGDLIWKIKGHEDSVQSVAFSPDSKLIASGGGDSAVRIWETTDGELQQEMWGHEGLYSQYVRCVDFAPDGRTVVSGGDDGTVRTWDVAKGEKIHVLTGHEAMVRCVAFSPDGRRILSGSSDSTLRYWDVEKGELIHVFNPHLYRVLSVAFSPNGVHALSTFLDNPVIQWDLKRKREVNRFGLKGNPWFVGKSLSIDQTIYSPNGAYALFGFDMNGMVILWDVLNWKEVTRVQASNDALEYVDFRPNSHSAITVGRNEGSNENYQVTIWDLPATFEDLNNPLDDHLLRASAATPTPAMVLEFPDKNLEASVRKALGTNEGPITYSDVQGIEILSATGQEIEDVSPLRYFKNLKVLNLSRNRVRDLEPIGDLSSLEKLILSSNQVSQLSPLTELRDLRYLNLANNKIEDIGPLSTLGSIDGLILDRNKIEEVDALYAILSKGDYVSLKDNPLSFISRIARLRGLEGAGVTVER